MAQSPESVRLTALFRQAQQQLGLQVQQAVRQAWATLDMRNVDVGWPKVSAVIAAVIAAGYTTSSSQAAGYLVRHGQLNGVDVSPVGAKSLPAGQIVASLAFTGPIALKRASAGADGIATAAQSALTHLNGSAQRLTLAGGRETVLATVKDSSHIAGYQRVGEGQCQWCADLIADGPLRDVSYFAAHDHDTCVPEPVYG